MRLNKTHIREMTGMLKTIREICGTLLRYYNYYLRKINGTVNTQVSEMCGDKQGNFWDIKLRVREITGTIKPHFREINGTVITHVSEICGTIKTHMREIYETFKPHSRKCLGH